MIFVFQVTENGDYEKLLASVKFPIWDYDYDGLISNLKLILKDSGVKDRWQIPDSNLDSFLLSIRSNYQGLTSNDLSNFFYPKNDLFSKMAIVDPSKCNLLTLSGHFNLFFQIILIIIFVMLFVSLKWYIQF